MSNFVLPRGLHAMALTRTVSFKTVLEEGDRVQVPKVVRWQFRLETDRVLRVSVRIAGSLRDWERFYAKMRSDGRLIDRKLTAKIIRRKVTRTENRNPLMFLV